MTDDESKKSVFPPSEQRLSSKVVSMDSDGRKLFDLLCRAAGVDAMHVRGIDCRCHIHEAVMFNVSFIGDRETIKAAIGSVSE